MRLSRIVKTFLKKVYCAIGFKVVRIEKNPAVIYPYDIAEDKEFIEIYKKCKPYAMTGIVGMYSLYKGVEYVVRNKILGDLVECGIWRGGGSMLMAYTLLKMEEAGRRIYLYDTYKGMTKPGEWDIRFDNKPAIEEWSANVEKDINKCCYASIEEVKSNLFLTGYPKDKLIFVEGDVENTIPSIMPDKISILRLDTDWYEGTYHQLCHLFPRLSPHGIIIIDDYGYWKGCKKAVDEYIKEKDINIMLNRIDNNGRIGIKY